MPSFPCNNFGKFYGLPYLLVSVHTYFVSVSRTISDERDAWSTVAYLNPVFHDKKPLSHIFFNEIRCGLGIVVLGIQECCRLNKLILVDSKNKRPIKFS